jgi:hypothetical protein
MCEQFGDSFNALIALKEKIRNFKISGFFGTSHSGRTAGEHRVAGQAGERLKRKSENEI